MFTNALFAPARYPRVDLQLGCSGAFPDNGKKLQTALRLQRQKWANQVFVLEGMRQLRVKSTWALEGVLMEDTPDLKFPDERPQVIDRIRRGSIVVARVLANPNHQQRPWIDRLLARTSDLRATQDRPFWRLADPNPISWVEYDDLQLRSLSERAKASPTCAGFDGGILIIDSLPPAQARVRMQIPYPKDSTLGVLEIILLNLRRTELEGDLINFVRYLEKAIALVAYPQADKFLRIFCRQGESYFRSAFGLIAVSDPNFAKEVPALLKRQAADPLGVKQMMKSLEGEPRDEMLELRIDFLRMHLRARRIRPKRARLEEP
jgi:hypothetical protein